MTGGQGTCIDRHGLGLEYEAWRVEEGTFCGIVKTDRCRADDHNCQEELSPFAISSRDFVLSNDPCTWPAVINFLTAGQYPKQSREKIRSKLAFHSSNSDYLSGSENKSDMTPSDQNCQLRDLVSNVRFPRGLQMLDAGGKQGKFLDRPILILDLSYIARKQPIGMGDAGGDAEDDIL